MTENGKFIPVTVIEAGPCVVVQKKTIENDGYEAVQIGFGEVTSKHVNKPLQGHFAKSDVAMKKVLREFRLDDCAALNVGDLIKADVFANGDKVDVCPALPKVKVTPAQLNVTATTDSKRPTVPVLLQDMQVPTALVPIHPVYSRANVFQVTWVLKELQFRTSKSLKLTLKTILSQSRVLFRVLKTA